MKAVEKDLRAIEEKIAQLEGRDPGSNRLLPLGQAAVALQQQKLLLMQQGETNHQYLSSLET